MITRRKFLTSAGALAGSAAVLQRLGSAQEIKTHEPNNPRETTAVANKNKPLIERVDPKPTLPPGQPGKDYTPVITPNSFSLPWKIVDAVKVFHLIAEPVEHEFAPNLKAHCWGYNGHVHGPTIEAVEGDRVRIYVTNRLPAGTSVHWHGVLLPNGMDGVAGLTQKIIQPGETFKYEFTLRQHGTQMYHSHHDEMTQMALGTVGPFVIHPRNPKGPRPDRDFVFMTHEWQLIVGTQRPNPNQMTDFNVFTFNAKAFPATEPMVAKLGDRVRIRLINLGAMSHHPIHLHGYQFQVTETDGGQIPESAREFETSVLTAVGQSRTFDFVADAPGDWPMHCHMTHHVMTQMGDNFPNMIGVQPGKLDEKIRASLLPGYMTMGQDGMAEHGEHIQSGHMKVPRNSTPMFGGHGPFDYITMGGLFTVLKVREGITSYEDPGWYQHPPGTVASPASAEELRRDGIQSFPRAVPTPSGHHHHSG
jgi:FtsP/CotA-like multicopper oxidase with cupredoxin domain